MKKILMLCLFVIACLACGHPQGLRVMHAPNPHVSTLVTPVYIDSDFTPAEVQKIEAGIVEINWALNGVERFDVVDDHWRVPLPAPDDIFEQLGPIPDESMIVLRIDASVAPPGVLGWVEHGEPFVNLVADRQPHLLQQVFEHEMFHTLGVAHNQVKGSMMYPYVSESNPSTCPDEVTVASLASVSSRFDIEHMNFCRLGE